MGGWPGSRWSMDELIRLKADLPSARNNVRQLESLLGLASAARVVQGTVFQVPRREATVDKGREPLQSYTGPNAFGTRSDFSDFATMCSN